MRTSGRGGSETIMFIAPAAIFGALFVWWSGSPLDLVIWLDRTVMRHGRSALEWLAALWS